MLWSLWLFRLQDLGNIATVIVIYFSTQFKSFFLIASKFIFIIYFPRLIA